MKATRILAGVIGTLVALAAVGLVVGGGALLWAYGTQRDADGFFTSPAYEMETDGYALTSPDIDLATNPDELWPSDLATVRLEVAPQADQGVFVGIGPSDRIDQYLAGVSRSEVSSLGNDPETITYDHMTGVAPAALPGEQDFWAVEAEGTANLSLLWPVEAGEWSVVVMNADATAGVDATVEAGAEISLVLGIGMAALILGLLLAGGAAALLVFATRSPDRELARHHRAEGPYPVTLEAELDPSLSRWLWLVKWVLAIPHMIVLAFLWIAFGILTVFAFFAILFTGRYPRSIFEFNVGVMRWSWRVSYYAYSALGTDEYPPFTLADVDYPARLDVEYPEELSRGLVLVKWWLLAIPHYLIVGLFTSGLIWWTSEFGNGDGILQAGGGLIGMLVIVAAVILAFTGRYPQGIFDLVVGLNRWVYRVAAYASLMRDEYPPFRLDLGGEEPPGLRFDPPRPPRDSSTESRPHATST